MFILRKARFRAPIHGNLKSTVYFLLLLLGPLAWATACKGQAPNAQASLADARDSKPVKDTSHFLRYTSGIRSILEDREGNFWFGSHNEGAARFDGQTITYFTVADGLSHNQVRSLIEGPDGTIWFECGAGISYFDGQRIQTVTGRDFNSPDRWANSPDARWFKGDEEIGYSRSEGRPGTFRLDGGRLIFQAFPVEVRPGEENLYSVSTPAVQGKEGRVWFGTYGAVIGYDGHDFTVIDDARLGLTDRTGHLHVRALFEDSRGDLWIGNNGLGVMRWRRDTMEDFSRQHGLVHFASKRNGGKSPPGTLEHVFSIGEDSEGNIWFGDRDTGVWKFDGLSMTNYTQADGLTTSHVWAIYRTRQDELWVLLADGSICRFNGTSFDKVF